MEAPGRQASRGGASQRGPQPELRALIDLDPAPFLDKFCGAHHFSRTKPPPNLGPRFLQAVFSIWNRFSQANHTPRLFPNLRLCLCFLSGCWGKISCQSSFQKEGFVLAHSHKLQCLSAEKPQWQVLETPGCIASIVKKQRARIASCHLARFTAQGAPA